jgi:shikimate dehydrogenase
VHQAVTAEVWGHPIGHSRSPELHLAAYRAIGLSGSYERRDVDEAALPGAFRDQSGRLTGISLTMPLKSDILDLVPDHRGFVPLLRVANTAVRHEGSWWLANTDPFGVAAMLRRLLPARHQPVWLVGAGATARAVLLALQLVGWSGELVVYARSAERAEPTLDLARQLGFDPVHHDEDTLGHAPGPGLVISTLPSGTPVNPDLFVAAGDTGASLIDVGYHPWPTPIARVWEERGLAAFDGLPMLMFQALAQIRVFAMGDTGIPLPHEDAALRAMAEAISLPSDWADPALMGD